MKRILKNISNKIRDSFFLVDLRILALFRISFGIVLFFDIYRRIPFIHLFYSNKGMLPTSYILSSPYKIMPFTLMPAFNQEWEVKLFMLIGLISCVLFIFGYRTILFQIIVSVVVLSIHNKVTILENGGDMVINNFIIWSLFLPLSNRWSIDSIRKSLTENNEINSEQLNKIIPKVKNTVFSLGFFACILQLCIIYFFNHTNKTGATWTDGTSIHYLFELDTFLTPIGYFLKHNLSSEIMTFLTYSYYLVIATVPLFFFPFLTRWIRLLYFIFFVSFHSIIATIASIGVFSYIMITIDIFLLNSLAIHLLKKLGNKTTGKPIYLLYDSSSNLFHFIARIIKRFDVFKKITWLGVQKHSTADKFYKQDSVVIVSYQENLNKPIIRNKALFHILNKIPFCFLFSWILLLPIISHAFNYFYYIISKYHTNISEKLNLSKSEDPTFKQILKVKSSNMITDSLKFIKIGTIGCLLICLIFANLHRSLVVNEPYKSRREFREFRYNRKILNYLRMKQNWKMFAPGVLKKDVILVLDVETVRGERIDPFTGLPPLNVNSINFQKTNINYGQFIRKFMKRSVKNNTTSAIEQLENWLTRPITDINGIKYSKIKNYKIWKLTQYSSKYGEKPKDIQTQLISEYPIINKQKNKSKYKQKKKRYYNSKVNKRKKTSNE